MSSVETGSNQDQPQVQYLSEVSSPSPSDPNMEAQCRLFDFLICVIVIGVVCVFGLVGNCTSFMVLVKHKTETAAVSLLQCIAISDSVLLLATLLVYTFPSVYTFLGRIDNIAQGREYIKMLIWPICMMSHTMTIYLTVLVTFNRYCAICRPIQDYRAQSQGIIWRMVLITLLFSVVYNFPRFFEHQAISRTSRVAANGSHNETVQSEIIETNLGDSVVYQIIYSNVIYYPVMYIFPLSCLTYLNYKLINSLKALNRKKAGLMSSNSRVRRENDHITLCVVVIVCVFIFCQTPALVNQIFWAALPADRRLCGHFHFYYTKISDLLVVINSSCNIVIYCLCGRRFRLVFLQTLCLSGLCFRKSPTPTDQTDVMLQPLEFQAQIIEASDNDDIPQENGTIEQAVSHV